MNIRKKNQRRLKLTPTKPAVAFELKKNLVFSLVLLLTGTVFFSTLLVKMPVAQAAGTISGRVFQDFNSNGEYNTAGDAANPAIDRGVANVTVTAYDASGAARGTTTTNSSGTYSLSATGTGPYRVEFTNLPAGYQPSARSTDSVLGGTATNAGSTVQFVNDGNTSNVNLAINVPGDYCQNDPLVCTTAMTFGNNNSYTALTFPMSYSSDRDGNTNGTTDGSGGAMTQSPARPTPTTIAMTNQIGTTYGVAWNKANQSIYVSSYMKRKAPSGSTSNETTGGIYRISPSGAFAPQLYVDLNAVFGAGTTGANPHPRASTVWDNDTATRDTVGKRGLGDLDISPDNSTLYTVNLADRRLYAIPTSGPLNSTTILRYDIPTTGIATSTGRTCDSNDVRPFGLGFDSQGQLYVGGVCTGETSANRLDLRIYVWRFTGSAFTLVFNTDNGANNAHGWQVWTTPTTQDTGGYYRQPILTDIIFDGNDMVLGLRDRLGDQLTANGVALNVSPWGRGDGDTMRACWNGSTWNRENNANCGSITTAGAGNSQGFGGGEYYYQDSAGDMGNESGLGSLAKVPGFADVMVTAYDAVNYASNGAEINNNYGSAGVQRFNNTNGQTVGTYDVYLASTQSTEFNFWKTNGIGDIEALCDLAPIEIGNRVWNDANGNGVQDPGENGIGNVTLQLFQGGVPATRTATPYQDSFAAIAYNGTSGSTNWSSTPWTEIGDDNNVATGDVRVVNDILFGNAIRLNQANRGISRAVNLSGAASATLSFSYRRSASQGATVEYTTNGTTWVPLATYTAGTDTAYQSSGNLTLPANATAIRFMNGSANGNNQFIFIDNVQISTAINQVVTTDTNGEYYFTGVQPNTAYEIRVASAQAALSGLNLTSVNSAFQNGAVDSSDSDAVTSGANYVINYTTGGAGNNNHTLDVGFSPAGNYSVGNRVWEDTNNNGQIDAGENGIDGVSVSIFLDADGNGVPDTPSSPIATQVTANGGFYRFDGLAANNYVIRVNPLNFQTGGVLVGRNSSIPTTMNADGDVDSDDNGIVSGALNSVGVLSSTFRLGSGASEPVGETNLGTGDASQVDNRTNLTIDFGFYTPSGPTVAKVNEFKAFSTDNGVIVEWQSGYELNNLGYRLWREQNGVREVVNKELVAGSALQIGQNAALPAGGKYHLADRTATENIEAISYLLEDIDTSGNSTWHGPISVSGYKQLAGEMRESLTLDRLTSETSSVQTESVADAKVTKTATKLAADNTSKKLREPLLNDLASDGEAVQIEVSQDGWTHISREQLQAAGFFDNPSNPRSWQLTSNGREISMLVNGDGSIEFEARASTSRATAGRVYWLAKNRVSRSFIEANKMPFAGQAVTDWFMQRVEKRDRMVRSAAILNGAEENFYGAVIGTWTGSKSLTINQIATESGATANVKVNFQGLTQTASHRIEVGLNGTVLGTVSFTGRERGEFSMEVPLTSLTEGINNVTFRGLTPNSFSLLENIAVTFPRRTVAVGNQLTFRQEAGRAVKVGGLTSENVRLIDITNWERPQIYLPETVSEDKRTFYIGIEPSSKPRIWRIEPSEAFVTADAVRRNEPSHLQHSGNAAAFLVIAPREFEAAAQPLMTKRNNEGLPTQFVAVQDIYDEFNHGEKSPEAIKAFLSFASRAWRIKPQFALLLGHATVDPKNYTTTGGAALDKVPTMLYDSDYFETSSDEMLADFNGDGLTEIVIGRLPAITPEEAQLMINKSLAAEYESRNWANRKAVLVQDVDAALDFTTATNNVGAMLPAAMSKQTIKKTDGDVSSVRSSIISAFNGGAMVVNYFGHGSNEVWTNVSILRSEDTNAMNNGAQLPVVFAFTCLNGVHAEVATLSLAEALLRVPNGGARGVFASSGMVNAHGQERISEALYPQLFRQGTAQPVRIGAALRQAKTATADRDIRLSFTYFGDPTSPFAIPSN